MPDLNTAGNSQMWTHISLHNHCTYLLYSHTCQMKWVSPDVCNTDKYSQMLNKPSLFEVALNRLPHFTTDTLSHSSWRSSIWSCNTDTCIQTQDHSWSTEICWHSWYTQFRLLSPKETSLAFRAVCRLDHCFWHNSKKIKGKTDFIVSTYLLLDMPIYIYFFSLLNN